MVPFRKLFYFLMLAAIVAVVAVEHRKPPMQESSLTAPDSLRSSKRFPANEESSPGVFVPVQSTDVNDLAAGKLLVATRRLIDPHFAKTVVLLIHYDETSAAGLVLNRRTIVPLSLLSKKLPGHFYIGGPVEPTTTLALLKAPAKPEGAKHVFDGVHLIISKPLFEQIISGQPDPNALRVYQGYAGWIPHQLEKEVAMGSWFIFPASADAVFTADPDSLWLRMIQKTELKVAGNKTKDIARTRQTSSLPAVILGSTSTASR